MEEERKGGREEGRKEGKKERKIFINYYNRGKETQ
jgi:hypothetical protein